MIAVHDWSLDRTLGMPRENRGTASGIDLLNLPGELAAHGYHHVQLCHFHLPDRSRSYLDELRSSLRDAEVTLDAVLIDDGDLTAPDIAERQQTESWAMGWIQDAITLGANRTRVIAGKTRTPTALADASAALGRIADRADTDMRIVTENWFDVTASAADVDAILAPLAGKVGLLIDLANWTGPTKYDQLAAIASYGETSHAKAHWSGSDIDADDYRRSLRAVLDAGFTGPLALVYDGNNGDEWTGLRHTRRIVEEELAHPRA